MSNPSSRYGKTFYLPARNAGRALALRRRRLVSNSDQGTYDENWLQALLFEKPEILPIMEFDPAFAPPTPLCRELRTEAGFVDLAYMSPQGRLTIVECKLWKNPEARRQVVSQILDYAKEIYRWTYDDLNQAVSYAADRVGTTNAVFELVKAENDEIDEAAFVDDVSRSLRSGKFLLIIVGDGIREEVEQMADYLQQSTGIRFTFGLVELAIFDMPEESGAGILVEPRILARTVEIGRSVVELKNAKLIVQDAPAFQADGGKSKMTSADFFRQIKEVDADLPQRIQAFFRRYAALGEGFEVRLARASFVLYWYRSDGRKHNFGTLFPNGELNTNYIVWNSEDSGDSQIGVRYLQQLAGLIPGASVWMQGGNWTWRVQVHGRRPQITDALARADDWLFSISEAAAALGKIVDVE